VAYNRGGAVLRQIGSLFQDGTFGALTDAQLLEKFASRHGESSELAFAAIVERHGPMVLRVCRGATRDPHEAEDAFQATFLVLVKKAGSLWVRESLGPWLHGVACRVASHARAAAARRRRHERCAAEKSRDEASDDRDPEGPGPVLHQEIRRLSGRLGAPVVLCYLEGLTHEQAAQELGLPVGTVRSRLARGRELLRERLIRRGVAPTIGALSMARPEWARSATVPAPLAEAATRAAVKFATGQTAGVVPASVILLTRGALTSMFLSKMKVAAALIALGLAAAGAGAIARQEAGDPDRSEKELLAEIEQLERRLEGAKLRLASLRRGDRGPGAHAPSQAPAPLSAYPPAGPGGGLRPEPAPGIAAGLIPTLPARRSRPQPGPGIAAGLSPAERGPGQATVPIGASVSGPTMAPGASAIVPLQPRQDLVHERFERRLSEIERKLDRLLEDAERRRTARP
jgi:RNA polymerase sigma factor (sigma-70 family)